MSDVERATLRATLTTVLKKMVGRQEATYSNGNTYASTFDKLHIELPEGVQVSIVDASKSGWYGIALDTRTHVTCAMGVGFRVIGWSEAQAQCSR